MFREGEAPSETRQGEAPSETLSSRTEPRPPLPF
jgi:hypothetical protein